MAFTVFDPITSPLTNLAQALLAAHSGISLIDSSISLRLSGAGAVSLYDSAVGTPLGIGAGVLLTSGITPGTSNTSTWYGADNSGTSGFINGDADIDAVVNTVFQTQSYDATTLKFDFSVSDPAATSISFDLVFGSDEYPEWVDAFVDCGVVIVDGVNYALFNNDPLHPLSVISPNLAAGYFQDNGTGIIPIEYDGVSGRLRIVAPLKAGLSTHTIKIGIADTGDHILDSGLFIANMSAGTTPGSGVVSNPGGGTSGDDNCSGSSKDECFDLQAGNDTVYAGGGADIIVAGTGNDMVYAGSGNDDLKGDGGDDLLDGGADLDTAVYAGLSTAYGLSYDAQSGSYSINGSSKGEGVDTLLGIEQLKFSDGLFALSNNGTNAVLMAVVPPPSPPVNTAGAVVLGGLAAVGSTLSATVVDADGVPNTAGGISWQWYSDGSVIAGATTSTYLIKAADSNHSLSVEASYTDAKGASEAPASAGVFVQALPTDGELTATLMTIEGPASASVNTTITTLLVRAVELGETPKGAIQKIRSALKLPSGVTSLLTTNAFKTLQSGIGDTATALALAKLEVQVAVLCSVSDDANGLKLALALLDKASSGGSYDLSKATDLAAILGLDTSTINFSDKTTWPKTLQEVFDRNNNIKDSGKLLISSVGTSKSIESEWVDFLSNWDGLADNVPLTSLSLAINQGPCGFATAVLPELVSADAGSFVLTTAQLTQGFHDPDGDPLSVLGLTTDQGNWFNDNGDGTWSIDPASYDSAYVGPLELSYWVEDGQGHSLAASQLMLVLNAIANHAPTGSVSIGGTPTQGQVLTAANTLADLDGIPSSGTGAIAYTWKADGIIIGIGNSVVLSQAQVGKSISVTASYTDNLGADESVSSTATAAVANINDAPTGSVTISGTPTQGQTLTAANTLSDVDGIPVNGTGAIAYQWKSNGTAIAGATATTYLLTAVDVGKAITVTASYIDNFGTAESVTSLPTAAIVAGFTTPPALSSISLSGSTVALTFSEALSTSGLPTASAFVVQTVSGTTVTTRTVSALAIDSSDPSGRRLLLTLGGTAPGSNVDLRVSYTDPSGNQSTGVLQNQAGNDVTSFSNQYATTFSSSTSVTSLASHYTTLILTGTSAINGTGNAAANTITGNSAVNFITGGAGVDSMDGGSSSDIYVVASASDHTAAEISDTGAVGTGIVDELRFSATSTTAGATLSVYAGDTGLERVIIGTGTGTTASSTGTTALNINASAAPNRLEITGNNGTNTLSGTAFSDTIKSGSGIDTITGGTGADTMIYTSLSDGLVGGSTSARTFEKITDFSVGQDNFDVTNLPASGAFKNLGTITALSDSGLTGLLTSTNFVAKGAATFIYGSGTSTRTFIAFNDATAGFSASNDAVLEITGYTFASGFSSLAQINIV
jgi:hypothetical protein